MSDAKHTPGPWELFLRGQDKFLPYSVSVRGISGQLVHTDLYPTDGANANARLIAAAPDLLEALKGLDQYLDQLVCCASMLTEYKPNALVKAARAAIDKAEGREP